jgi:large subunit ribosomal protein L17
MRHRKSGVKLNRTTSHRQAMFRNMVTSLLKHDRIKTTEAKAKELRRWADHIVTLAKRGDLHARRVALSIVREKDVVHKLFEEASERFGAINGGYTRIVKIGRRPGDSAPLTIVELVSSDGAKPGKDKKAKRAKKSKPVENKPQVEARPAEEAPTSTPAAEDTPAEPDERKAGSVDSEASGPEDDDDSEKASKTDAESGDPSV